MRKDEGLFYLSDKPYFHCILSKSQVKPKYQMALPSKVRSILPSNVVPVVLTYQNKNWNMLYYGDRALKRFDPSWRNFAMDNNLRTGDGIIFELVECSAKIVKFRVQILSGDIPSDFLKRIDGESLEAPILIE
ncbi:PREDICTED: B3 domain-containing protein Os04g0386900-like [Nelumbo nucifera]|uniref:TF-B3 domain-containing protein n=2 Tax=Nelumbo nucifera TaxID=4432 RepID=A0A822Z0L2_NELNU|nr:PREDICTED: B3 domain-containing protein Os04g0386900-like [Nelumbo nucifera]DAD37211.1 TPA_asm: hypothetical protein HUJ06_007852 [Nelumbo nucifera]